MDRYMAGEHGDGVWEGKSVKLLLYCLLAVGMVGCTRSDLATRVLQDNGFKNVEITGWRPFMCGEDDHFSTGFRATKEGRTVTGCVCSGVFKGSTIRFD